MSRGRKYCGTSNFFRHCKGSRRPPDDRDILWAPAEEWLSGQSKRTLWGAWRRGLAEAAPVPKDSAVGDAISARLNWASSAVSPGKKMSRSLASQERSYSRG